ncbi:hypothetical protein ACFWMQ_25580 [Streptomyces sp. NPDC058372]|uniref:hypothetical protein n=1 Tax=Streptomyces sp. NPDC058372 TaxID=3346464 RepID=UPI003659EEDA
MRYAQGGGLTPAEQEKREAVRPEAATRFEAGAGTEQIATVTRAGWWIDHCFSQPEDLTELIQAATGADRPTENPHF